MRFTIGRGTSSQKMMQSSKKIMLEFHVVLFILELLSDRSKLTFCANLLIGL